MQKNISITIGAQNFLLEEAAYNRLAAYISSLKSNFGPTAAQEIMPDFEVRIAEHLKALVAAQTYKQDLTLAQIEEVIAKMGATQEISESYKTETAKLPVTKKSGVNKMLLLGGVAALILLLGAAGLAYYFLSNKDAVKVNQEELVSLSQKTAQEYYPVELDGKKISIFYSDNVIDYKAFQTAATNVTGKDSKGESIKADLKLNLQANYNKETPEKLIKIVVYKYTDIKETNDAVEIYQEVVKNAGEGFQEKGLKINGAQAWLLYRTVASEKATTISASEVIVIFPEAQLGMQIAFNGGYTETEVRAFTSDYIKAISSKGTNYIKAEEVLSSVEYLKIQQKGLLKSFQESYSNSVKDLKDNLQKAVTALPTMPADIQDQFNKVKQELN
jgi:hypothetical protein